MEFEKVWQKRLQNMLDKTVDEDVKQRIMTDSDKLMKDYNAENVISWTKDVMERLKNEVNEETLKDIMTGCACHYPKEKLSEFKNIYAETGDVDLVHKLLQKKFEKEIKLYKKLNDNQLKYIIDNGWGMAGIKEDNIIYATKIPSKFHEYFAAVDKKEEAYCYCHCPRIRDVIKSNDNLTTDYCYCGAGFYKDIWQTILQKEVRVEVIKSVLKGDDVCMIKIFLP